MREPRPDPSVLEATALRYAARDLSPAQCEAFEARLAGDQSARDALAEAVRLSAAALGRGSPPPDRGLRSLIRERIQGVQAFYGWMKDDAVEQEGAIARVLRPQAQARPK